MKVCMFVKNSFEYDARVTKEAKTLIGAGHDVTVVAIHVPNKTAEQEVTKDGIRVIRVSRMSFGMRFAQRAHARYIVGVEERHARLSGTDVDDDAVRKLVHCKRLKFLSLAGTRVADRSVESLKQLQSLEILYLGDGISDRALEELRKALPNCQID